MIRRFKWWAFPFLHPHITARHHRAIAAHAFDNAPRPERKQP